MGKENDDGWTGDVSASVQLKLEYEKRVLAEEEAASAARAAVARGKQHQQQQEHDESRLPLSPRNGTAGGGGVSRARPASALGVPALQRGASVRGRAGSTTGSGSSIIAVAAGRRRPLSACSSVSSFASCQAVPEWAEARAAVANLEAHVVNVGQFCLHYRRQAGKLYRDPSSSAKLGARAAVAGSADSAPADCCGTSRSGCSTSRSYATDGSGRACAPEPAEVSSLRKAVARILAKCDENIDYREGVGRALQKIAVERREIVFTGLEVLDDESLIRRLKEVIRQRGREAAMEARLWAQCRKEMRAQKKASAQLQFKTTFK